MTKNQRTFEPMETLLPEDATIGDIVLYVMPTGGHHLRPAIVSSVIRVGVLRLHVFSEGIADALADGQFHYHVPEAHYSLTGEPGTWRWESRGHA